MRYNGKRKMLKPIIITQGEEGDMTVTITGIEGSKMESKFTSGKLNV